MNFWGLFNFDFGYGMNNWFTPTFSLNTNPFFNNSFFFSSYQFPTFNFTPSIWNIAPVYSYTPTSTAKTEENTEVKEKAVEVKEKAADKKEISLVVNKNQTTLSGYNACAGTKLANIALNNSVGWTGYCAKSVKNAICKADLGSYQYGHAYQMPSILRNNKNFKEIPVDTVNVKDLPAGCVLVYDKGSQGYSSKYGHTEITTGDGRAVSDGITKNLYKKPSAIFMPVEHNYLA